MGRKAFYTFIHNVFRSWANAPLKYFQIRPASFSEGYTKSMEILFPSKRAANGLYLMTFAIESVNVCLRIDSLIHSQLCANCSQSAHRVSFKFSKRAIISVLVVSSSK